MPVILVAMALLISACTPSGDTTSPATSDTAPAGATIVTLDSVLDGDSLRVVADGQTIEVRLLGINAPERDECWADEAREALRSAVADSRLSIETTDVDQYGRNLAYVYAGATNVNRLMVGDGNAIAMAVRHDRLPNFLASEAEAIDLERGLWSPTVCGSSGEFGGVMIWAIEPNAPGRDDQNPNGEFVSITNEGRPIDIGGWRLRDESSIHRFRFPDEFVLDTGDIVTVRSGCGQDAPPDLYWCADGTVWTNSGDTVLLLDDAGAVVARERYFDE